MSQEETIDFWSRNTIWASEESDRDILDIKNIKYKKKKKKGQIPCRGQES